MGLFRPLATPAAHSLLLSRSFLVLNLKYVPDFFAVFHNSRLGCSGRLFCGYLHIAGKARISCLNPDCTWTLNPLFSNFLDTHLSPAFAGYLGEPILRPGGRGPETLAVAMPRAVPDPWEPSLGRFLRNVSEPEACLEALRWSHVQVVIPHGLLSHLCPFRRGSEGRFHVSGCLWTLPAEVSFLWT